jgi:N6-adenosine-specific RNA methylase IME4
MEWIYKCGRSWKYCKDGFTGRYNELKEEHKRPAVEMSREWLEKTGREWNPKAIAMKYQRLTTTECGNYEPCQCDYEREPAKAVLDLSLLSGKKFGTIYADPPWAYSNQGTRASTNNHYDTMNIEEIANLPIKELAADKSHLHLWTTNAFLFECPKILESWGFEYKGVFVWIKPQMGIGNYWRVSHEFLILGVRGGLTFLDHSQMSWVSFPRSGHSKKPEEVASIIEKVSPGPRLELFGRRTREGWTVFGNEIKKELFNQDAFNS